MGKLIRDTTELKGKTIELYASYCENFGLKFTDGDYIWFNVYSIHDGIVIEITEPDLYEKMKLELITEEEYDEYVSAIRKEHFEKEKEREREEYLRLKKLYES